MKVSGTIGAGLAVAVALVMACGGSRSSAPAPAAPSAAVSASAGPSAPTTASAGPAGVSSATASGGNSAPSTATGAAPDGATTPAAASPGERPFARDALEAQQIIQSQIDAHIKQLWACVNDYRAKKKNLHKGVVVAIGIDEEGNLLGVTSANAKHGELDKTLKQCMFSALHGLPFPRSHAGIITVKQSFNDMAVYTQ